MKKVYITNFYLVVKKDLYNWLPIHSTYQEFSTKQEAFAYGRAILKETIKQIIDRLESENQTYDYYYCCLKGVLNSNKKINGFISKSGSGDYKEHYLEHYFFKVFSKKVKIIKKRLDN